LSIIKRQARVHGRRLASQLGKSASRLTRRLVVALEMTVDGATAPLVRGSAMDRADLSISVGRGRFGVCCWGTVAGNHYPDLSPREDEPPMKAKVSTSKAFARCRQPPGQCCGAPGFLPIS
jgi:hypothetical protein